MINKITLEVCVAADNLELLSEQLQSVLAGGAQRVELCARMDQDGLTPSVDAISLARSILVNHVELLVMVRPRGGSFCYNNDELGLMCEQIVSAANSGADGVVFGVLDNNNELAIPALTMLMKCAQAQGLSVTFHRAFDALNHPQEAISKLVAVGVRRILSSGTPWGNGQGAAQGLANLAQYLTVAKGQIEIVVGGGVKLTNLVNLHDNLLPCLSCGQLLSFHCHSALMSHNKVDVNKVKQAKAIIN